MNTQNLNKETKSKVILIFFVRKSSLYPSYDAFLIENA